MVVNEKKLNLKSVVVQVVDESNRGKGVGTRERRLQIDSKTEFSERLFGKILKLVAEGNEINVMGFGKFSSRLTRESARNPKTEQVVPVKDRVRLKFTASVSSRSALN